MDTQEEKIKQLYADGVLTKEEMDAELQKFSESEQTSVKPPKKNRLLMIILTISIVIIAIVAILFMARNSDSESSPEVVVVSPMDGTESPVETAKWSETAINGQAAIVTKFHHPEHGTLEVAYNPSMGLRFARFDSNDIPKQMLPGSFMTYPVACTQQMIDEGRAMPEMLGEELMNIIQTTKREGNYIYCDNPEGVQAFLNKVNEGSVTWLQLSQFVENGNTPSATDYGGDYVHYLWGTHFKPGDLAAVKSKL